MSENQKNHTSVEDLRVPWSTAFLFIFFIFFVFNLWQTVHERWVVKYQLNPMTGQMQVENYNVDVVLIGLGIMIFAGVVLLVLKFKPVWRFLTSMQLGIVLTGTITVGTILGTLVFQNAPEQDYISFYSEPMYMIFKALHLVDVFDAWWFLATEILLCVGLVAITIRLKPWSPGKIGIAVTHLGVVAIIIGAFVGVMMHVEGVVLLGEGEKTNFVVSDSWVRQAGNDLEKLLPPNVPKEHQIPLNGEIVLDRFDEIYYDEPYVVQHGRTTTRRDIRTGEEEQVVRSDTGLDFTDKKPLMLKDGAGKLQITNIYRNYLRTETLVPDENGEPMATVEITNHTHDHGDAEEVSHSHSFTQLLRAGTLDNPMRGTADTLLPASNDPMDRFMNPNNTFRLRYTWIRPTDDKLKELGILDGPSPYIIMGRTMEMDGGMGGDHLEARLKLDTPVALGNSGYTLTLKKFYNHLNVKLAADGSSIYENASDLMMNPSVDVAVTGGEFTEPLVLNLSARGAAPNDKKMQEFVQKSNLMLGFIMAPPVDLILVGSTGELLVFQDGALQKTVDLKNETYTPLYTGLEFKLLNAVEKGRIEVKTSNDNPVNNYAVDVKVEKKDGTTLTGTLELLTEMVTREEIMNNPHRYFLVIDEKNQITFSVRSDYIKDWLSHVVVNENGQQVMDHSIRVNEPLIYSGYYFYQSDWYPKVPYGQKPPKWYTYLRVNYDAGLPLVYLGIAGLIFGSIYHFYVAPVFRRKKNGGNGGEGEN